MGRKASARGEKRGIGDSAVAVRTGKTWCQWFALLNRTGARNKSHQQIVAPIAARYAVSPWWQQVITVTYEQGRGLRPRHETDHGYPIRVSRTLALPAFRLCEAGITPGARQLWILVQNWSWGRPCEGRRSTPNGSPGYERSRGSPHDPVSGQSSSPSRAFKADHTFQRRPNERVPGRLVGVAGEGPGEGCSPAGRQNGPGRGRGCERRGREGWPCG